LCYFSRIVRLYIGMKTKRVLSETTIYWSAIAKKYPHLNLTKERFRKWRSRGIKMRSGNRMTLDWYTVGGSVVTSVEAMDRFLDYTNR